MRSQRVVKQTIKSEKLPQSQTSGQSSYVSSRKNKNSESSNVYTVKETTYEKRVKRSYKTDGTGNSQIIASSNLKQGTNSGFTSQNKIPVSNQEETNTKIEKKTITNRNNISEGSYVRRYTKRDIDKIVKIQRWWRRMLAILNGYRIRESLRNQYNQNYIVKDQNIYSEEVISSKNLKNSNSKSYLNINNLNNMNSNRFMNSSSSQNYIHPLNEMNQNINFSYLSPNMHMMNSNSQNYIQTVNRKVFTSPRIVQSVSTSPSVKSRYIIETKKVEIFRKPKNYSANKFVKENNYNLNTINSISNYEIKQLMRDIWNEENYCSTVESLCCLGDDERSHNVSQNNMQFEEYEEEIKKLKTLLMQKDDELNDLMANLKENEKRLKINKNLKEYKNYNQNNYDQDAHELQIISTKYGWNDVNIPSPVNEIFIEQIKNELPQRMQYIEGMQIMGNDRMRNNNYNMEQWTQIILSKKREDSLEYSIKEKTEKKSDLEMIPREKEPLVSQKIEQINITSLKRKPRPRNQIQELDGLEIINRRRNIIREKEVEKVEPILKRKVFVAQNVDKICIKSLITKKEYKNMIQELDGIEIIKAAKEAPIPQCVDELEIPREYDMLLVKPTWNSLQIQGSGLNLLALPRDMGLENQEVDEFEILGMEKPDLYVESMEQISYEKPNVLQKIQVLIPIPENNIEKLDNFRILGIQKQPETKTIEKKVEPNKISKNERFRIYGETKRVEPNKISKNDRFRFFGKQKDEKKVEPNKISKNDRFGINGLIKEEKKVETIQRSKNIAPNDIINQDSFQINGIKKMAEKVNIKNKIIPYIVEKLDNFNIEGIEKEPQIRYV